MAIWNWIQTNWVAITAVVGTAVVLAGRIVELTPTDKDNKALDAVIKVLKVIGLKVGPADPDAK